MKECTIENIQGCELPADWRERLGVLPDERVSVTIRRETVNASTSRFDRNAVEKVLNCIAELPVLDDRTPEEILNYDESGLPI